jgi:uncharacterized membrane protein
MQRIMQTFVSGLVAALPLALTIAVTAWLVVLIAEYVGPSSPFGQFLSRLGLGVTTSSVAAYVAGLAIVAAAIYLLGLLVETRLANWMSPLINRLMKRVPIVSSVYGLSKQFTAIVDLKGEDNVKSMSAVWCFFGGEPGAAVLALLASSKPVLIGEREYLGILVPSAPVPVGGALVYVPSDWIRPAEGGIEHLMSVYVSMGVTSPLDAPKPRAG